MARRIESIEGIGPKYGTALRNIGIDSVEKLLDAGCEARGRKALAEKTGINEGHLLKCVNMADLFRIKGIGGQYAELLESAGVDTVKELRNRNAASLAEKMRETNKTKKVVRQTPADKTVEKWVAQAKQLSPKVRY